MLVLSRKKGEQIVVDLGDCLIFIRIIEARRSGVRIGITAPPEVAVQRAEIWKRKLPGQTSAARLSTPK